MPTTGNNQNTIGVKNIPDVFVRSSLFILIFLSGLIGLVLPKLALANPVTQQSAVTLTIVADDPPSTPILVSPNNNSYVTDSTPTFVWKESTDDNGIDHYTFYLNGTILFDNLPTGNQETSEYIYTYDSVNDRYSLTLKNALSDGTYTWKVRVTDVNSNGVDSATWTFTLDTQAPSFIVTFIGGVPVFASAQDPGTIPPAPVPVPDNEPLVEGTGEANSTVEATLTIPGDPTQFFSFSIDGSGNWSLQLGLLPRNVVMTLDFIITDQAGHVSVLNDLEFYIEPIIIIIPPSPSPTPTPSPGATPTPTPSATPIVTPTPTPLIPPIEIPIIPPREAVFEVISEIFERLPAPIQEIIANIPEGIVELARDIAPVSAAVVAATIPIATAVSVASQLGGNLSLQILARILQSLGILPVGKPQGIVFNSETSEPIPFAILTIYSADPNQPTTIDTVVTDVNGIYSGVKLSPGMYRIEVSHQDFYFPSKKQRPAYLEFKDFYRGEVFKVESERQSQLFLIPMDPKELTSKKSLKARLRLAMSRLARLSRYLTIPLFFISGFLAIIFPSIWNTLVFLLYAILVARKIVLSFKKPIIKGLVADQSGQKLENTVVRVVNPNTNELISILTTQKTGDFRVYGQRGIYKVDVNLPGYMWKDAGAMSFNQVDTTKQTQDLTIVMQSAQGVYDDLFSENNNK